MFMLFQLKAKGGFQGFISTSYLGEVVEGGKSEVCLEKTCTIYEVLSQKKEGDQVVMDISTRYYTNSLVSNGQIKFNKEDVLFSRVVEKDDELLGGYNSAFEALRMSKLNLQKASAIPNGSDLRGRN